MHFFDELTEREIYIHSKLYFQFKRSISFKQHRILWNFNGFFFFLAKICLHEKVSFFKLILYSATFLVHAAHFLNFHSLFIFYHPFQSLFFLERKIHAMANRKFYFFIYKTCYRWRCFKFYFDENKKIKNVSNLLFHWQIK